MILFFIFTSLLNICLIRRQMSWLLICFAFSLKQYHTLCSLWQTLLYTHERMRVKKTKYILELVKNGFHFVNPLRIAALE